MLDAYRDLIDELLGTPTAVKQAPLADEQASSRLRELAIADADLLIALQRMTREDTPLLSAKPDTGGEPAADARSTQDPATTFDVMRGELVSLLMNLTLKDWEAKGIDDDGQMTTVADLVERHVELDEAVRADLGV